MRCEHCGALMVKASFYDPDGMLPLKVMERDGEQWTCIAPGCEERERLQVTA